MRPVCGKPYEYCRGQVKTPYFRHMNKTECEDKYSESETEEHINGKRDLYEWIKTQDGVTNAVLEGWIPETKQRPDIMFMYDNKQYVIEYQCSPIATEYIERHELYKASDIVDIWICGTKKYLQKNMREKYLQQFSYAFYDPTEKNIIPISYNHLYARTTLHTVTYCCGNDWFYGCSIKNFCFKSEIFDKNIGTIDDVIRKRRYREEIKKQPDSNFPKRHNKYLNMQTDKIHKQIQQNLELLSNENWKFYIKYTQNKYKTFQYIIAEPRVTYHSYLFPYQYRNNFNYERINIDKMDYDNFKRCGRDIEYLKSLLLHIMQANKEVILNFRNKEIRFMEVQK